MVLLLSFDLPRNTKEERKKARNTGNGWLSWDLT